MNKSRSLLLVTICFLNTQFITAQNIPQLWGTTQAGGDSLGYGTVYKINGDGSGYQLVRSLSSQVGGSPVTTPVLFTDGNLYGTSVVKGPYACGALFSVKPGSNVFSDVYNVGPPTDSLVGPIGPLVAAKGLLYGCTIYGNAFGGIFSFNPVSKLFTVIHDFKLGTGFNVFDGLYLATDGKLYGTAPRGGKLNFGVLFSLDINNNNTYTDLHDFDSTNGTSPYGRVTEVNGIIYGTTYVGGSNNVGTIYSYNPSTSAFNTLYNFTDSSGSQPVGAMVYYNNLLYGVTQYGGKYTTAGIIFSYNISTNTYTNLHNFELAGGVDPIEGLCLASDGKFYGTTDEGGANNYGTVFKFDETTNTYYLLYSFGASDTDGEYPHGGVVDIYGTAGIKPLAVDRGQFIVYPNPTTGLVTISSNQLPISQITITNILGQVIYTATPKQTNYTFELKDEGMYFVTITSGNETTTQKVLVVK